MPAADASAGTDQSLRTRVHTARMRGRIHFLLRPSGMYEFPSNDRTARIYDRQGPHSCRTAIVELHRCDLLIISALVGLAPATGYV